MKQYRHRETWKQSFRRIRANLLKTSNKTPKKINKQIKIKNVLILLLSCFCALLLIAQTYTWFISIKREIEWQYFFEDECKIPPQFENGFVSANVNDTNTNTNRSVHNANLAITANQRCNDYKITFSFIIVSRNDEFLLDTSSLQRLRNLVSQITQFNWHDFHPTTKHNYDNNNNNKQNKNRKHKHNEAKKPIPAAVYVELIIVEWNSVTVLSHIRQQLSDLRATSNIVVRFITVSSEIHQYLMTLKYAEPYKYYCKTCKLHEWIAKNAAAFRACGEILIFLTSDSMPSMRLLSYLASQSQNKSIPEPQLILHPNTVIVSSRPSIDLRAYHPSNAQCPCILPNDISAVQTHDVSMGSMGSMGSMEGNGSRDGSDDVFFDAYASTGLSAYECTFFHWDEKYGNTAPGEWHLIFKSTFARIGGYMEAPQIAHADSEFVSRLQNVYHLNVLGLEVDTCGVYHQDHSRADRSLFPNRVEYDGCNMLVTRLDKLKHSEFVEPMEYIKMQQLFTFSNNYQWINERTWGIRSFDLPEIRWTPG